MIKDGDNLALSGFTPNGNPKAIFRELSQRAIREHEAGNPFAIGIFTGASSCQSVEGDMANAHAIKFRAPFSTNADFRNHVNLEEIDYEDMHLGHMAERMRHGFYGGMDWAVIEVSHYEIVGNTCRAYLTSAGGIVTTAARLAKRVILEHNTFHNPNSRFLHDTYEPADCGFGRKPIPVLAPYDRVGHDYVAIDVDKIVGVIDSCIPEEARAFKDVDEFTSKMGHYVAEFLAKGDMNCAGNEFGQDLFDNLDNHTSTVDTHRTTRNPNDTTGLGVVQTEEIKKKAEEEARRKKEQEEEEARRLAEIEAEEEAKRRKENSLVHKFMRGFKK